MEKSIDVSALTAKVCTYQQFLNFIRQPKNWLTIAVNIAVVAVCIWLVQYGLSRPFVLDVFSAFVALGITAILSPIEGAKKSTSGISDACVIMVILTNAVAGAIIGFMHGTSMIGSVISGVVACLFGALVAFLLGGWLSHIAAKFIDALWERYGKYCLLFALAIMTFMVLLASSFQNVDARSWKFDRGTGKLVERTVFIWPGSTLEREYNIVERKPQKEIPVWIWFSAQKNSGWSYKAKNYSFRDKVVLTCNFKNHRAYQKIHGTNFPEIFLLAHSPEDVFERVTKEILSRTGLTSEDIEFATMDGLE